MNDKTNSYRQVLTIVLCFLLIFCGLGMIYPRGLFVVPITKALNISRSAYSLTDTIRSVTCAVISAFFGLFIEKFGSKVLICAGFIAYALGALAFALAENVVLLYVGSFLFGVGLALASTAVVGFVINRICDRHKGPVLGVVLAANGLGGAVFSQVYARFLAESEGPFGYRNAYYVAAIILAAVLVLIIVLYRSPDHSAPSAVQQKQRSFSWEGIDFGQAKKTVYFYLVCVSVLITGLSLQGLSSVKSAYLDDAGLDIAFVATVSSVGAVSLAGFKFFNGYLYEKTGLRVPITTGALSAITAVIILFFITNSTAGKVLSVLYTLLMAIALPLETVMLAIYASELFGEKSFGKVLGILLTMHYVGSAIASPAMNMCFDLTGSYKPAFVAIGIAMALMLIMLQIAVSSAKRLRSKAEKLSAEQTEPSEANQE